MNPLDLSTVVDGWHEANLTFLWRFVDSILDTPVVGTTVSDKLTVSSSHVHHACSLFIPICNTNRSRNQSMILMMCTKINEDPQYSISIVHPYYHGLWHILNDGVHSKPPIKQSDFFGFFNFSLIRNRHLILLMLICIIYYIVYLYVVIVCNKNMCLKKRKYNTFNMSSLITNICEINILAYIIETYKYNEWNSKSNIVFIIWFWNCLKAHIYLKFITMLLISFVLSVGLTAM